MNVGAGVGVEMKRAATRPNAKVGSADTRGTKRAANMSEDRVASNTCDVNIKSNIKDDQTKIR